MTEERRPPLDESERAIIVELQRDGRTPVNALAKSANISEVTARRKLNRLFEDGVIQVAASVDPFSVGIQAPAIVGLKVMRDKLASVAERVAEHRAVRYVAASTGNFHLIIEVMARSNQELASILLDEIGQIDGVIDTETSLVLRVYKQNWQWEMD